MDTDVTRDWKSYINERKEEEINSIIKAEKLNEDKARKFIENSLRDGFIKETGTDLDKILPPTSRFGGGRRLLKQKILIILNEFLEKYLGIV